MTDNISILKLKLENAAKHEYGGIRFSMPVRTSREKIPTNRIILIENGTPSIQIGNGNEVQDIPVPEGHVIFANRHSLSGVARDTELCRTFGVCFMPKQIKIVSYTFHGAERRVLVAYHLLNAAMPQAGINILEALEKLSAMPGHEKCAMHLVRALFQMTLEIWNQNENDINIGKSEHNWRKICSYLEEHLSEDLSRRNIAALFKMNQSYLSTLCHRFTGKTFNESIRDMRLSKSLLLLELNMSLDEISEICGFRYTNYFIRKFKEKYGISPGKFRIRKYSGEKGKNTDGDAIS